MKRKIMTFALTWISISTCVFAQASFKAASCADLCSIVLGANSTGNVMSAKYKYKLVNNYNQGNGFVSLYSQATVVNINTSEIVRLEREGVSNVVLVNNFPNFAPSVITSFFSQANANKFIEQMKAYGFQKTEETEEGWPVWKGPNGLRILEEKAKQGRFTHYAFFIKNF